ncbi:MAG: DUF3888 domain-containing protein [Dethiobacteraceae bacterium]|jgi:hypothetical protein|nr:DUF3888 domain-containing protein [Bacillota bacterium]
MLENKKPIITLLCINALLAVVLIFSSFQSQPTQTKVEFVDDPLAKNKSDALLTLLQDSIELACKVHYKRTGKAEVIVEPNMMKILDLKRTGDDNNYVFTVEIKVTPYSGAHQLGEDHLTMQISKHNVQLLEFTHLKDLPAPAAPALQP